MFEFLGKKSREAERGGMKPQEGGVQTEMSAEAAGMASPCTEEQPQPLHTAEHAASDRGFVRRRPGRSFSGKAGEGAGYRKAVAKEVFPDVFDENCMIASVAIPKKDIFSFIRGKVEPVLGPDYYYGYVYRNGCLSFIATRSPSHLNGRLSVFTPAFLAPGRYAFRWGSLFHLVETTDEGTVDQIVYEKPDSSIDLNEPVALERKAVPATLWLTWSLKRTWFSAMAFSGTAFLLSLLVFLAMTLRYETVAREAMEAPAPPALQKTLKLNPNIGALVKKVGSYVAGKGLIRSMQARGDIISFSLLFDRESDARAFMAMAGPGAVYENGVVVVAVEPDTGNYRQTHNGQNAAQPTPAPAAPNSGGKP